MCTCALNFTLSLSFSAVVCVRSSVPSGPPYLNNGFSKFHFRIVRAGVAADARARVSTYALRMRAVIVHLHPRIEFSRSPDSSCFLIFFFFFFVSRRRGRKLKEESGYLCCIYEYFRLLIIVRSVSTSYVCINWFAH